MDLNGVKYDAFISYRHSPVDMYIAKSIHKRLENFKLPKSVLERVQQNVGKTKIQRVFRDQDELPLADNLSDPIDVALGNSDYLIAICTPRLPESKWCRKEITSFIKKHDRDHVLAVLAEGEPYESFPYELTHEEVTITNPDGTTTTTMRELEPLAADVRGKNKFETEKKLDDAAVRLCAAMFELNYDDLKQRHKEQQTRRRVKILGGIAGAMFIFAMVCLGLLLTINSQKKTIDEQYGQIQDQYDQIQDQYVQIQDQYVQIQDQYAEIQDKYEDAMGTSAEKLLNEGRRNDALYALTHATDGQKCKSRTEFLLSKALNLYSIGGKRVPTLCYDIDSNVEEMVLSQTGKRIALKGASGEMVVFDTATGKRVYAAQTTSGQYGYFSFEQEVFAAENVIYFINQGRLCRVDTDSQKGEFILDSVETVFGCDWNQNATFAFSGGVLYCYDVDGKEKYRVNVGDLAEDRFPEMSYLGAYTFSPDDSRLALEVNVNVSDYIYVIIDVAKGEVISSFIVDEMANITDIAMNDNMFFLMEARNTYSANSYLHYVHAYDILTLEELWNTALYDKFYTHMIADDSAVFLFASTSASWLDATTGQELKNWSDLDGLIKASFNSNSALVISSYGDVTILYPDYDEYFTLNSRLFAIGPGNKIFDFVGRDGAYYIMFSGEKYATKYEYENDYSEYTDYNPPEDFNDYKFSFGTSVRLDDGLSKTAFTSSDEKYTFSRQYDGTVVVTDANHNEVSRIYDFETELSDVAYVEELDRYILKGYSSSYLLDENFQIVGKFPDYYDFEDGNFVVYSENSWYKVPYFDTKTIIDKAGETLGDYVPSEEVAAKYGITID